MSFDLTIDEITFLVVAPQNILDQDPPIIELIEDQFSDLLERFPIKRSILRTTLPSNWSDEYDETFVYTESEGRFQLLEHPMPMNIE